jgi:hypothetical protein
MSKKILLSAIGLLLATAATACEEGMDFADDVSMSGVTGSSADTTAAVTGGDGPSSPIAMEWQGLGKDVSKKTSGLALTVTNVSSQMVEMQISIEFAGLINKIENTDLGKHYLAEGESIDLNVAAKDFPVQCPKGACQARAEVIVFYANESDEVKEIEYPSGTIYYRHDSNYSKVALFTEETLIEKLNGNLSGKDGDHKLEKGEALGRVKNKKGGFDEVLSMSDEFAVVVDGKVVGWQTGADISIGYDK